MRLTVFFAKLFTEACEATEIPKDSFLGPLILLTGSKYPNEVWQEEEVSMRVGESGTPSELVLTLTPRPKADLGTFVWAKQILQVISLYDTLTCARHCTKCFTRIISFKLMELFLFLISLQ